MGKRVASILRRIGVLKEEAAGQEIWKMIVDNAVPFSEDQPLYLILKIRLEPVQLSSPNAAGLEEPTVENLPRIWVPSDVPPALAVWYDRFSVKTEFPAQGYLHIFDPANADLGAIVRSLTLDPVKIIARDDNHARVLREAGVPEENLVFLDRYDGNLEAARRAAEAEAREEFKGVELRVRFYPESERSKLFLWIQEILSEYGVTGVSAEQIKTLQETLSLLLSA